VEKLIIKGKGKGNKNLRALVEIITGGFLSYGK
jgi:hypothetical protein